MALYIDKSMVDGVEELPRLTQEEFDAIPVAERPKIWVKRNATETDRGITAEDVQYDSTQSTKQAIDAIKSKTVTVTPSIQNETIIGDVLQNDKMVSGTICAQGVTYSATTWITIATVNKKPKSMAIVPCLTPADGTYVGMVQINTDGTMRLYSRQAVTTSGIWFTFNYATDD